MTLASPFHSASGKRLKVESAIFEANSDAIPNPSPANKPTGGDGDKLQTAASEPEPEGG